MQAMAAGATLASMGAATRPLRALPANPDVVVIGAGAAGIAAARRLIADGHEVVIVEAADRIGGRAWTDTGSLGVPFDRGCSWLQGPASLPHVAWAREQGFDMRDHSNARDVFFIGDRRANATERRQRDRAWAEIYQRLGQAGGDVAAASVIPQDLPFALSVATWIGPMDFGVDIDQVSTADWYSYADYEVNYLLREGLGTVVARLGAGLPVRLGTPARSVDWGGSGVRVVTDDGTITARACIVTVSTGVLASGVIRFTPDLPAPTQEAIAGLPMGQLLKIGLLFDGARFGLSPDDLVSHEIVGSLPSEACYFLAFPNNHDYVVGFAGGTFGRALEREGEAAAIDFALQRFTDMLGSDVRRHFRRGLMAGWDGNPLTKGAYSAVRPGRFAARAALAEPLGERVFFAGEAMATPYAALLSGAHLHGDRVAGQVARLLNAPGCSSCDARGRNRARRLEDEDKP